MTSKITRSRAAMASLAVALLATVAACGSDGSDEATTEGTSSTSEAEETTTTSEAGDEATTSTSVAEETTTTLSSEGRDTETSELDALPDGDHYGYMAGLEEGMVEGQPVQVIIFDPVELLTGQAAIDAAEDDGVGPLDTDYYVRNPEQTVLRLAVVPDASVTSLDGGSATPVPSSVDEVWQQEYLFEINVGNVRDITTVSSIEAVYLP